MQADAVWGPQDCICCLPVCDCHEVDLINLQQKGRSLLILSVANSLAEASGTGRDLIDHDYCHTHAVAMALLSSLVALDKS